MIWIIFGILAYIAGGIVSYKFFLNDVDTTFEKIWFSIFWICLPPLYLIHYIHNKE